MSSTPHVSGPASEYRPVPPPAARRTLADARPGDDVRVCAIPDTARDLLAVLGLSDGATVHCTSVERYVVVRTPEGIVPLDRAMAAQVAVEPMPPRPVA